MFAITTAANDQIQVQVICLMAAIICLGTLGIYLTVSRLTRLLQALSTLHRHAGPKASSRRAWRKTGSARLRN